MTREITVDENIDTRDLTAPTDYSRNIIFQRPEVTVKIEGTEFLPTELKVETNRFKETGTAEIVGIWNGDEDPERRETIRIKVNDIRIFKGSIEKVSDEGDGAISIEANDIIKKLIRLKYTKTYQQIPARRIVQDVCQEVKAQNVIDLSGDTQVSPDYKDTPGTSILDQVAKWTDRAWWVDAANIVHVESIEPTVYNIGSEFILEDPTAGQKNPPYEKVIVYGDDPASRSESGDSPGGQEAHHMLSKNQIVATAGEGEPVYKYESKQIKTKKQADRVANSILKEFKRQSAIGSVTIVGEGIPIRPLDVIKLPDRIDSNKYIVSSIKHTFNNQDGLISDINVGGFVDE